MQHRDARHRPDEGVRCLVGASPELLQPIKSHSDIDTPTKTEKSDMVMKARHQDYTTSQRPWLRPQRVDPLNDDTTRKERIRNDSCVSFLIHPTDVFSQQERVTKLDARRDVSLALQCRETRRAQMAVNLSETSTKCRDVQANSCTAHSAHVDAFPRTCLH